MSRVPREESRFFLTLVARHLAPLYKYARRQLRRRLEAAELGPSDLSADEVVNEVFVTIMRRHQPGGAVPSFRRLQEATRAIIGREVARARERARLEVSLETPVGDGQQLGGGHPEEEIRLADVLPDPTAVIPGEEVVHAEFEHYLERSLAELPREWVEAFLLHSVDGLSPGQVAALAGASEEEVLHTITRTRAFLRAKLLEQYTELARAG